MPAKAGIHLPGPMTAGNAWIPAFAAMTVTGRAVGQRLHALVKTALVPDRAS